MEILTAPLQTGTDNVGFLAQFPAKKGPGNLTPKHMMKKALRDNPLPQRKDYINNSITISFGKRLEALTRTPCNLPRALKIFPLEWYFGKSPFPVGILFPRERGGGVPKIIR